MEAESVRQTLVKVLTEIQTASGRSAPPISNGTCPFADLPGFDSYNAFEAASMLSGHFGRKVEPSLFFSSHGRQPMTVEEITNRVCDSLEEGDN